MFLFQSRQYLTTEPLFFDTNGGVFEWHDFAIHGEAASVERGGNVGCGTIAIVRNGDLHIHIAVRTHHIEIQMHVAFFVNFHIYVAHTPRASESAHAVQAQ